mgnify:CR=1 FL=1
MRITLDTNFLISATQWDYSVSNKLFLRLIPQGAELFISQAILDEFSKVLLRDFHYSVEEANSFIKVIISFFNLVEPIEKIDALKEDPEDNIVLECAVASHSDYILTYEKHLLNLKDFRGIKISKPEEMFEIINFS